MTPIQLRRMRPSLINHAATNSAVLLAMAKLIPCADGMMAVLTPITSPPRIVQRTAGIAGIQGRVGLHDIVNQPAGLRAKGTAQGADHSGGHCVVEIQTGSRSRQRFGQRVLFPESANRRCSVVQAGRFARRRGPFRDHRRSDRPRFPAIRQRAPVSCPRHGRRGCSSS